MKNIQSVYVCPECHKASLYSEWRCTLSEYDGLGPEVNCPKCHDVSLWLYILDQEVSGIVTVGDCHTVIHGGMVVDEHTKD